jgi:nucleoside 2-deoxyribosyltransferase
MTFQADLFAFVLMPFDSKFDDVYRLGIKETATASGILAERVDEQIYSESILERIYRQIDVADFVIADMTGQNPNVFYEVGYAHAKKKICILVTQDAKDIPFDLKHHRHIIYGGSIQSLRTQLTAEMEWARNQIKQMVSSRLKVTLRQPHGNLEKTRWAARGSVDLQIDLQNDTDEATPELETIYFYCGRGWTTSQAGHDMPSIESDLPEFQQRHFLNPPVRRLQKGGWAQLKFSMKKLLAWAGEEPLQDSYKHAGKALLRIVTNEGIFDYPLAMDVEFIDMPF